MVLGRQLGPRASLSVVVGTFRIACVWLLALSAWGLACAGDPPPPRDAKGRVILASEDGPSMATQAVKAG